LPKANNGPLHEGTVIFTIDAHSAGKTQRPVRFPPLKSSGVVLSVEITRRGRLALAVDGLPFPMWGCQCAMPADDGNPITIGVTWIGTDVRAFVAGEQVSGIREQREGDDL